MKFKFLAMVAISGMVFAGCSSDKQTGGADSSTTEAVGGTEEMVDTTTADTTGTGSSIPQSPQ